MQTFPIQFFDNSVILFDDVITLTVNQKEKIIVVARKYNRNELTTSKTGIKILLTTDQIQSIVTEKERIVSNKSVLELQKEQIVEFTEHSIERIIKRYKGNQLECYLSMIDMVKKSTKLNELAEWKGFKSLAYTFLYPTQTNLNKIVLTFVKKDNKVKIVTVMNDIEVDSMDYRLSEDDQTAQMLLNFRNQLKAHYKS